MWKGINKKGKTRNQLNIRQIHNRKNQLSKTTGSLKY